MDLRKIKKLIEMLENSTLAEMEISEGENSVRLSRNSAQPPQTLAMPSPVQATPSPPSQTQAQSQVVDNASTAELANARTGNDSAGDASPGGKEVVSPLVGTFYDSPSPQEKPYVTVGSVVNIGDTLCLIEAMKTFNQIEAEIAGVVSVIHKQNGQPVEYGEPVFVIVPSHAKN